MTYPKYIIFKNNINIQGILTVVDSEFDLPFDIKRIFYITNLDNYDRGFHAHKKCEQILIAISGKFTLVLDDGNKKTEFILDKSNIGVYIPLFHWLKMINFSSDCIILVICSYKYDENEYIRNYEDFILEVNNKKTLIDNFSLKEQTRIIKKDVMNKIEQIIDKNEFTMGNDVLEFENNFSLYNDSKFCIALSNGCSALKIAIKSLQLIKPKIIIQANTYVAVPLVCEELNIPYDIIDIDDNLLLDLDKLSNYFEEQKNIKEEYWFETPFDYILIVVHLYGNCIDMNKLLSLKDKYNFKIIEDAAQAHGSIFNNKKLGTFGDLGCFSFYPSKNLGSFGEGGAIITNNEIYDKYCRYYRNYGCVEKYNWEIIGSNERMHNIQGGILNIKLNYLDKWNNNRRELANIYYQNIKENNKLKIIKPIEHCISNIHLFILIVENRDDLKYYLENNNIKCSIHYPKPFYDNEAYKHKKTHTCEKMEYLKNKLLSLPMFPELSKEQVLFISDKINKFYSN